MAIVDGYNGNSAIDSGSIITQLPDNVTTAYPFITIDPIPDHYIGDIFSITGTTNLPPDIPILVDASYGIYHALGKQQPGQYVGSTVNATIKKEPGDVNTWEAVIDTSGYNRTATQDEWAVTVIPRIFNTPEDARYYNLSAFRFLKGPRPVQSTILPEQTTTIPPISTQQETIAPTPTRSPVAIETILVAIGLLCVGTNRKRK
jgi:hypothetical protein